MNRPLVTTVTGLLLALSLTGCVSQQPVRGWIPADGNGESAASIVFVDQDGRERSFKKVLGDYTVLALTHCDQSEHGPATRLLEEIVAENRSAWYVRVAGVDVHWSERGCGDHSGCHLVSERRELGSLCDVSGAVRNLYGIGGEDGLYVIGPDRKIVASAPFQDAGQLRKQLQARVASLSEARTAEIDPG